MTLKAVVDSLDGVDQSIRSFYKPGEGELEGKHVLQVESAEGLQLAPVTKLQNALQSARQERDQLKGQMKQFVDEEGNPLDISQMRNAIEELEKLKKSGDGSEKLKQLEESLKQQYATREQTLAEKHKKESEQHQQLIGDLKTQLQARMLESDASKAISEHGGIPEVLMPHIQAHVKSEEVDGPDGKKQLRFSVVDPATGAKRFSTRPGSSDDMSISELVGELKQNKIFAGCFRVESSHSTDDHASNRRPQRRQDFDPDNNGGSEEPNPVEAMKVARRSQRRG